ncbi:MAG: hypothetical protein KJ999_21220 [Gammaproteobacteria bacterium]|nr:hypothetical protein [Gammaproteobacteria bacterium]
MDAFAFRGQPASQGSDAGVPPRITDRQIQGASAHRGNHWRKTLGRSRWGGALLVVATLGLQGCTSLNAERVNQGKMTVQGAPYNLTFTQFDLTIKHRLVSCVKDPDKSLAPGAQPVSDVKIETTVGGTRREARDPAHEYVIDFAALRSFFKTTDVAVEYYDNGALKSVNATVDDKTAEFLKSSFSVAAKVAMLTAGAGADNTQGCSPEVRDALVAGGKAEQELKAKTALLTRLTTILEKRVAVASALGPTRNVAERQAMANEVTAVIDAKAQVDVEQAKVDAHRKRFTLTTKRTWPKDGGTFAAELLVKPLTRADVRAWVSLDEEGLAALKDTGVWARFTSDSASAKHVLCTDKCVPSEEAPGLKYRMAMPGTFQACSNATCAGDDAELFNDTGLFSQLGPIMTLPLRNYPFMTQTVVLTMNEAGQPTKLGYRSEAGAQKAMDTLNTFVDEYGKVRQARKPKSELELVKEQTELLEAKAKLATAKAALEPNPSANQAATTAALKADTALLEAELAKLKAQAALDEALKQGSS